MEREWIDSPKGDIETAFGMMEFTLTSANTVHLSAGSGSDRYPGLEVNGVAYHVSAHLSRDPDGTWTMGDDYRSPYMSRSDNMKDPTPSARKRARVAIREAWQNFITDGAGNMARLSAELGHVNNDIMSLDEKHEKAVEVLRGIEGDLKNLIVHEDEVGNELQALRRGRSRKHWEPEE